MEFCMNDMLYAFSYALDSVAKELVGVSTYHAERVAYVSVLMGKKRGYSVEELTDLATCATLHDSAIAEYIQDEFQKGIDVLKDKRRINLEGHCIAGEKSVGELSFYSDVKGAVLYHHEAADGSGPFGKKAGEIPFFAEIIHAADEVDTRFDLSIHSPEKHQEIISFFRENEGILFSKECTELFLMAVEYEEIAKIEADNIGDLLRKILPLDIKEYDEAEVKTIANLFARITDYKSSFTSKHSMDIASKAEKMAEFYGYEDEKRIKLYFVGAVHDLGKLVIHNDILEKPDKLTKGEFTQMKNHAYYTYKMLQRIRGLEDITRWAALHHEKLNGAGYPFGYTKEKLSFEEKLMACLDIYQALTEARPYKEGFSHEKSMLIMEEMVEGGLIDGEIVKDIASVFEGGNENEL